MAATEFTQLVTELLDAIGQSMASVREVPEGILVKTGDGFLYAFVEDPTVASLGFVERLYQEVGNVGGRLVVLAAGRFPLALTAEVARRRGTVVDSARFHELARGLGLGPLVGDEPKAAPEGKKESLLPSARQLDEMMTRARTWGDWGVPALALRFYRQAATMKPEFLPARNGVAQSLLALGLPREASAAYGEVLTLDPHNLDARIGKAAVLGATGKAEEELRAYRQLLQEDPGRSEVRAHLIAALVDASTWGEARREIEVLLERTPDDPRLRYLHAAALERTGEATAAARERERARGLGLPFDAEKLLAGQLGLQPPPPPPEPAPPEPSTGATTPRPRRVRAPAPRRSTAARPPPRGARRRTPGPAARKHKKRRPG